MVFDCGCDIRWIQLWQQRGEAGLQTQQLYCKNGAYKIRLRSMSIASCGRMSSIINNTAGGLCTTYTVYSTYRIYIFIYIYILYICTQCKNYHGNQFPLKFPSDTFSSCY